MGMFACYYIIIKAKQPINIYEKTDIADNNSATRYLYDRMGTE